MEKRYEGWAQGNKSVKFCPMCRTKIEKNEGCNHMTCLFCSYDFCWHCLGYAGEGSNHFSFGQGCGADQFGEAPQASNCLARICKALCSGILMLLVLIVMAIFGPFLFLITAVGQKLPCLACLCCPLILVLGAIGGAIAVCLIPPFLIIYPFKVYCWDRI